MNFNFRLVTDILELNSAGITASIITAIVLFFTLFKNMACFIESIKYWFTLDHWYDRNEMFSDRWWTETKIFVWVILSYAVGVGTSQMF